VIKTVIKTPKTVPKKAPSKNNLWKTLDKPAKKKAIINMVGVITFVLPLSLLVAFGSLGFVEEAYIFMEQSGDPGGLHYRFIIKGLIPTSFFILIFMSVGYFARNYNLLKRLNSGSKS
jgi:TRAP-type mannitol/chloroaromatic compound transport system permease small subunit